MAGIEEDGYLIRYGDFLQKKEGLDLEIVNMKVNKAYLLLIVDKGFLVVLGCFFKAFIFSKVEAIR